MIKISIIMPVYNTGIYLEEAIKSIQNQSFQEWELICVNNNSSDQKTIEILEEWSNCDERIRVVFEKEKGAGNARNLGLLISEGEYIIFLDADDIFDTSMLEKMYSCIQESKANVCVCGYKTFIDDEEGRHIAHHNIIDEFLESDKEQYLYNIGTNPWTKLCRTNFLRQNNIQFQNLNSSNDVYFSVMLLTLTKNSIVFVNEMLVQYRQNIPGQISSNRNPNDLFSAIEKVVYELTTRGKYNKCLEKQIIYLLIKSGFYELGTSINKENNKQFYDKVKLLLNDNQIHFMSGCANEYVSMWQQNGYDSGWIALAGDYKKQIEIFANKWDIESIIQKKCVLWGFGKRGRAFWEWIKYKYQAEIKVYDEGVVESVQNESFFIRDDSWKNDVDIIVASNQAIHSIALNDIMCKNAEIFNLEDLCPF